MDYYNKLRPWTDIKRCECSNVSRILLVYTLTDNPIHCYECKGELDPERLKLTSKQVDQIASWLSVFSSLYELWLDSGEYEEWAKERLLDKKGQVNIQGISTALELSKKWPSYYWWFYDEDDPQPIFCPNCGGELDGDDKHGHGKCDACHVVV